MEVAVDAGQEYLSLGITRLLVNLFAVVDSVYEA